MIRHANMDVRFQFSRVTPRPVLWTAALLFAAVGLSATEASAASARVRLACAKDYFKHCSQFPPSSPQVRKCMRDAGDSLSPGCVNALVADGEVSAKEVAAHVGAKGDDE